MKCVRIIRAMRIALFGVPHRHKWTVFHRVNVYQENLFGGVSDKPQYYQFVMRCEGCGDLKRVKI